MVASPKDDGIPQLRHALFLSHALPHALPHALSSLQVRKLREEAMSQDAEGRGVEVGSDD